MSGISKVTVEVNGKTVVIKGEQLPNALKRKLRKESEKYLQVSKRVIITEPVLNEEGV